LQEVKQLLWMLIVSAIGVALCALCFPNGEYVAKLTGMTRYKEAIGPFINRNHAGMFFTLNSLVALGLFFTYQLRYKFVLAREQKNTFVLQQVSLAVLTICLMIGAVFTRSRGAMLSLLVGLFTYAVLCFWSIPSQLKKRLKGFFYTFVLLILSVGCIYTYVDDINEFAHRSTGTSAEIRQMMYRSANRVLRKYPIWGIGVGSMPVVISSYTEWDVHKYIERLHNDWLEMTLGMGYAGAGLVFIGLLWFMWKVLRRLKRLETRKQFLFAALLSALVAMGVGSLVDFHFFIPGCALVFFVILGVVLAPTFHKHHVHEIRLSAPLRLLVCTVLIGAAFIPLQKTRCWRQFFIGNGLKTEAKLKAYEQGLSYYPGAHYAARLANAYYNASLQSKDEAEKLHYLELALQITQHYLEQYPKDKELSKVYIRAWRQLR
ncbi:MAG: O-antigen ligase family protein, partial [Elusimicrobiaceae bacterium]|nr:O-antigen ligase family protein [Elusimicrobiaceae bacterium]